MTRAHTPDLGRFYTKKLQSGITAGSCCYIRARLPDANYILESLREPNAKFAKGYEHLTISPMPPLGMLLKEQELEDIVAYLQTLKTPPKDGVTVPVKKPSEFE